MSSYLRNHYLVPSNVLHTIIGAFALSLLLNVANIFVQISSHKEMNPATMITTGVGAQLPIFPRTVALEVVDSERYGMEDDNDWASVTPLGHGFVKLGADGDFYAISMYHQLHCLNSFRKIFNGHRNASRAAHDQQHELHCLTYLRQMALCSGDLTLEPAFFALNTDGRKTQAAYGTGVTHQCRDWVQVRQFSEANYELWKDEAGGFAASEANAIDSVV
ncbi:hypothetical protein M422DRAFT_228452 [Sphaerobolus stellatus SS14]|uniref:Uncharacterized protein n=1 Tax=Sphaerobolus stellatus (strain SS14) TaxID=990650 RepID=A0A0C9VZ40_SPHS4|nr:hypothetical protein M422DRAFT_228452 [Sphaerobolus stellatus SS14]